MMRLIHQHGDLFKDWVIYATYVTIINEEPTKENINDLIDGTDKIIKAIF